MIFNYDSTTKSYSATVDAETAVEIGDKGKPSKFYPSLKVSKWNDEFNFQLTHRSLNGSDNTTSQEKIKWQDGNESVEVYGIDPDASHPQGAIEFLLIFNAAPASNIITFDYKAKGAVFHYQGPLTDLIGQDGIVTATETEARNAAGDIIARRPGNVVGSYAVYIDGKKHNKYKAGKMFHIYRPKVTDALNNSALCSLSVDEQKKEVIIIIPQSFLDVAVYPIKLDPTFGNTAIGGSEAYFNSAGSICHIGSGLIFSPASGYNRIRKFTVYGRGDHLDVSAYTISGGLPSQRVASGVEIDFPASNAWTDSAAVAQTLINGLTYGMAEGDASDCYVYFDTGTGNQRSRCLTNLPATWVNDSVTSAIYSWYATYEEVYSMIL